MLSHTHLYIIELNVIRTVEETFHILKTDLDIAYPNTCCHNVLLLTMILTSTFMYFCNTVVFCPCVLTVAIAIK